MEDRSERDRAGCWNCVDCDGAMRHLETDDGASVNADALVAIDDTHISLNILDSCMFLSICWSLFCCVLGAVQEVAVLFGCIVA